MLSDGTNLSMWWQHCSLRLGLAIILALHPAQALGLGRFEDELRRVAAVPPTDGSPVDLRVAKAVGTKGYNKVRVSVVSQGATAAAAAASDLGSLAPHTYNESFKYRWVGSFDLGMKATSCGAAVYNKSVGLGNSYDADCMLACTHDPRCRHYTWFDRTKTCELAGAGCSYQANQAAEATYATAGNNVLASAVVSMTPGQNHLKIGGHDVSIHLPAEGEGVRGIVISDPCFSGRWVDCQWGVSWHTFNRTVTMLNALASAGDIDFFGVLGDNFYDQDGRLTKAVWDRLNLDFKSKFLLTMPGNHDVWVPGGPPGDQYDQYGWGLQQFFAQDTVASLSAPFMDFSGGGPDVQKDWSHANNFASNSFFFHTIGNIGFIGYNGAITTTEQRPFFDMACEYMGNAKPDAVFLLGHWNDASSGCPAGADVPEVHELLLSLPGCEELGVKLKYMDGHTHCNHPGGTAQASEAGTEEVGFMIGGHGMDGCSQYGFTLVDSFAGNLTVTYFEERNAKEDYFDEILACVKHNGASGCTGMGWPYASTWLDVSLKHNGI